MLMYVLQWNPTPLKSAIGKLGKRKGIVMGMFDWVDFGDLKPVVEVLLDEKVREHADKNLPSPLFSREGGQTKSLDSCLQYFTFRTDSLTRETRMFLYHQIGLDDVPNWSEDSADIIFCSDVTAKICIMEVIQGKEWDVTYEISVTVVDGIVKPGSVKLLRFEVRDAAPRIASHKEMMEMLKEGEKNFNSPFWKIKRWLKKYQRKLGRLLTNIGNKLQYS
jgi:hypothetical protein